MQDFRKIGSQLVFRTGGGRCGRRMTHDREFGRGIITPTVPRESRLAINQLSSIPAYILPPAARNLHISAMFSFSLGENGIRSVEAESVRTPLGIFLAREDTLRISFYRLLY